MEENSGSNVTNRIEEIEKERRKFESQTSSSLTGSLENRLKKFADNPVSVIEFSLADENLNLASLIHALEIRESDYINFKGSNGRYDVQIFLFGADTQSALSAYARLSEKISKIKNPGQQKVHITTYKEGIKSFLEDAETIYVDEIAQNPDKLTNSYKTVILTRKALSNKQAADLMQHLKQEHPWLIDTLVNVAGLREIPYLADLTAKAAENSGMIRFENDQHDAGSKETPGSYLLLRPKIADSIYLKSMNAAGMKVIKKEEMDYGSKHS